jgi:hypothetical protein
MKIKVEVIADVTVYHGTRQYPKGSVFDYEGEDLERLIEKGFLKKIGAPDPKGPAKTEEEIAAEAAAKKRKKAEAAAVKKGLVTSEEVAQFSDDELQELFKK